MQRFAALFVRSFFKGVILLAPLAITVYLIVWVFTSIDALVPMQQRGIGFLIVVLAVTGIGFLGTRWFLGKVIFDFIEHLLERTPGIKHVYSSIKDVMDSFVGDKRKFNNPVWVRTSADPELWRIGFLTQENMSHLGLDKMVAVYLPHSYAISGWVIVVQSDNVRPVTSMNPADAMKFAVSGGIAASAAPEVQEEVQQL